MTAANPEENKRRKTTQSKRVPKTKVEQYENFSEMTEAEKILRELGFPADLDDQFNYFRTVNGLTPENLEKARNSGFAIANQVSLEVVGLQSDILEAQGIQKSFNQLANSQGEVGELFNLKRTASTLKARQEDILIPITKTQVKTLWGWAQNNALLIVVILFVSYVGYDKLIAGKANGNSSSSTDSNNSSEVQRQVNVSGSRGE